MGCATMQFNLERKSGEVTCIQHVESQNYPEFRGQPCAPLRHYLSKCLKLGSSINPPPCSITQLISWPNSGRCSHHHPPCFNSPEALWIPTFMDSSCSFTKQEFWLNHRPLRTVPSLSAFSSHQRYRKNKPLITPPRIFLNTSLTERFSRPCLWLVFIPMRDSKFQQIQEACYMNQVRTKYANKIVNSGQGREQIRKINNSQKETWERAWKLSK